jgi:RNA polymerase sigma-70 factor (ECF subfamily)
VSPLLPEHVAALSARPHDPETLLLQHEQDVQLYQELATMPPPERLLLEQWLYQGCSYQEMAEQIGAPLNTVKARICRGRRRLAARLNASRAEEPEESLVEA